MSNADSSPRRYPGHGSLYLRNRAWYGHWRNGGRQVKRKLGPARSAQVPDGLTEKQANQRLAQLMHEATPEQQRWDAFTEEPGVAEVADAYIAHARRKRRKPSTLANIESEARVHLAPFLAGKPLHAIRPEDVADLIATLEGKGLAAKTVRNIVATLSSFFTFAMSPRRRWTGINPCIGAELPAVPEQTEIRFLTLEEVDALVAAARPGTFQATDRAIFRTAAMTGLRKGELVALRWRDIDWRAARIRVRQNYVRGMFGTPKSKRSTRSVPMADQVGGELERLFQGSRWQGDGDLVFAHPATGKPLPKANITRRMRAALRAAGLDETHRFHDLRHTFGTRMAATPGVSMRTLQEWLGHRDLQTTQRYADYAPGGPEAQMVAAAFARPPAGAPARSAA